MKREVWTWPEKKTPPYNWHAERVWPRDGYYLDGEESS